MKNVPTGASIRTIIRRGSVPSTLGVTTTPLAPLV